MNTFYQNGRLFCRLRAPLGTDSCTHGNEGYSADANGVFNVPLEAAAPLMATGGFVEAAPLPPPAPYVALWTPPSPVEAALAQAHATPAEVAEIILEIEALHHAPAQSARLTLTIPA